MGEKYPSSAKIGNHMAYAKKWELRVFREPQCTQLSEMISSLSLELCKLFAELCNAPQLLNTQLCIVNFRKIINQKYRV